MITEEPQEQQPELLFYVNDHLNTPQQLVDRAGVVRWSAVYTPFGEARVSANSTVTQNLRFAGQYYDEETGCHYNWNRYYCPAIGRYTTSDPIGLAGGLNTYLYANANPLKYIDPTGEFNIVGAIGGAAVELGVQTFTQLSANEFRLECVNIDVADVVIAGIGGGLFPGAGKVFTDLVFPGKIRKARKVLKGQLDRARTTNRQNKISGRINTKNNAIRDTVGGAIAGQVVTRTSKAVFNDPAGGNSCECQN